MWFPYFIDRKSENVKFFFKKAGDTTYWGRKKQAKTKGYLPESLVDLNSILLKITFGSYKFFGFFKRANYNSM